MSYLFYCLLYILKSPRNNKYNQNLHNFIFIFIGYDFNDGVDYSAIFRTYKQSGFQATNFGLAVEEILRMLVARRIPLEEDQEDNLEEDEFIKRRHGCTIFLGYTSNMASCGVRETIRFLAEHRMV